MPSWLKLALAIIVLSIITLVVYNLLKKYVFSRFKINKWIILSSGILILILPTILQPFKINLNNNIWNYVLPIIVGILFIWFLDSLGFSPNANTQVKKDSKNNVVIKPKAKPNRVKNLNKNANSNKDNK